MAHFVKLLTLKNAGRVSKKTKFASIGPVTSRTLRQYGLNVFCEAKVFTIEGLVDALRKTR